MKQEKTGLSKEIEDILYDIEAEAGLECFGSAWIDPESREIAAKKIEELVNREAMGFFVWHNSGASRYINRDATIEERYKLYLESKDNDK